jgi:hypothetical protein
MILLYSFASFLFLCQQRQVLCPEKIGFCPVVSQRNFKAFRLDPTSNSSFCFKCSSAAIAFGIDLIHEGQKALFSLFIGGIDTGRRHAGGCTVPKGCRPIVTSPAAIGRDVAGVESHALSSSSTKGSIC